MSWLGESEETRKNSSTPGYFSVGMSCEWRLHDGPRIAELSARSQPDNR